MEGSLVVAEGFPTTPQTTPATVGTAWLDRPPRSVRPPVRVTQFATSMTGLHVAAL
jgi:hypothetical protein